MSEISEPMRRYRDMLDRHRIPWADDTQDTAMGGGYRLHIERTRTELDGETVSVIWGYQEVPGHERIGTTYGWPESLELWYRPVNPDPVIASPEDIMSEAFGIREGAR